ncbi:MAG: hypothetical protein HYS13_02500 [Planctomycetia bacterium]|nr:hypothetical protein [Planctomycetia bacterium]
MSPTQTKPLAILIAVAAIVVLAIPGEAAACPSCKSALAASDGGGDLVSGFFWSILFMLSMPVLILASLATYFYLLVRKARAQQAAAIAAQMAQLASTPAHEPADEAREEVPEEITV